MYPIQQPNETSSRESQPNSENLLARSISNLADRFDDAAREAAMLPSEWLEQHFWVPDPRDVETAAFLPTGPIRLADHQARIVNEVLSCREDGKLKYSLVIYSAPKKSGKSAISAGINLYMAYHSPYSRTYCLANDGKQANDRIFGPIRQCIELHRKHGGGIFSDMKKPNKEGIVLSNGTQIESIPCDASGEAGAQPLISTWSELWGYSGSEAKSKLWTEMTVPSTLYGRALRWVESYAGFKGISKILEQLYGAATKQGAPHPDFTDLVGYDGEPVVWVNEPARIFCYWDTVARMAWQQEAGYFAEEAATLDPQEFNRVHRNQWISPLGMYIQESWWNACRDESIPEKIDSKTPVVVAIDAATENDTAAIVAVTRHHDNSDSDVAVRECRIFAAPPNQSIILSRTIGKTLQEWGQTMNIVCVAFDAYQMKKLVQDYQRGIVEADPEAIEGMSLEEVDVYIKALRDAVELWYYQFGQQKPRGEADKLLYDMILAKQIHWRPNTLGVDIPDLRNSDQTLSLHLKQAGKANHKNQTRIEKIAANFKVDAAVALSMAADRCLALDLYVAKESAAMLRARYLRGEISHQEYIRLSVEQVKENGR